MQENCITRQGDQYDSLVKLVEKITIAGKITRQEQALINRRSRTQMDKLDSMAVAQLNRLMKTGAVRRVE